MSTQIADTPATDPGLRHALTQLPLHPLPEQIWPALERAMARKAQRRRLTHWGAAAVAACALALIPGWTLWSAYQMGSEPSGELLADSKMADSSLVGSSMPGANMDLQALELSVLESEVASLDQQLQRHSGPADQIEKWQRRHVLLAQRNLIRDPNARTWSL